MAKEIKGIMDHDTFEFLPPGSSPPDGYQLAPLRMIYSVKPDLHLNSRLVLGEHKVKANKHSGYASVVQQITQYYSKIPRT